MSDSQRDAYAAQGGLIEFLGGQFPEIWYSFKAITFFMLVYNSKFKKSRTWTLI